MTSTVTTTNTISTTIGYRGILRATGVATLAAVAATEGFTGVVRAAGVRLAVGNIGGSSADVVAIGPGACTIMVVLAVAVGTVLAVALQRYAKHPASTYRRTTYALTVLSFAPDLFAGATAASSKLTLMAAHVLAAAIVIPWVARSLRD